MGALMSRRAPVVSAVAAPVSQLVKIVLVGQGGAGKSCMFMRLLSNDFQAHYTPSTAPSVGAKCFKMHQLPLITMELWDIPSVDVLDMLSVHIEDADAVLCVTDASSLDSVSGLSETYSKLKESGLRSSSVVMLVGNKSDSMLEEHEEAWRDTAQWARNLDVETWLVSALTGKNVLACMKRATACAYESKMLMAAMAAKAAAAR
eukprot:PLAT15309.1.p1 GENE.PLAT15309.1~~PLAT15309.1.p1  ORF type:complete len:204 (-),score=42.73 PLAT15309.1:103-714(-)